MRPIRVLVADDHPLYREALARIVMESPDLEAVGEARDWEETLSKLLALRPDVAVLDLKMPGAGGPALLRARAEAEIPTRVLFLSAYGDAELVYAVVAAGADGFLMKDAGRRAICESIVRVARGDSVLAPELQGRVLEAIRAHESQRHLVLTPREQEIMQLVSQGHSNAEVAARLFLSPETVKSHLRNVYGKLEVPDRSAAVAEAMRRGIIE